MKRAHTMPFGASLLDGGGVLFRYWAPGLARIELEREGAEGALPMLPYGDGWHHLEVPEAAAGDRYRFKLPDGLRVPDPASRRNPDDVHGASEVVDPRSYHWHDVEWHGRPWHEAVIYELHIGTFTPEGTFAAAKARLPELAELGFTVIEVMPVADFPGQRGWGYDGVLLFAPDAVYGTPDELKAFVDAAHALGLMVLLDVVYNHFGPEGNYLHAGSPAFFNPAHQTPWGAAINYDGELARTVRDFFVHNALYWVEEFRFDGLRMDAVHAIRDDSDTDIVQEICAALRDGPGRERLIHVVLENDANGSHYLERDADNRPTCATAQWNDDLHHAAHVLVTGERDGYYADYADDAVASFGVALAQGFVYQGQPSQRRAPRRAERAPAAGGLRLVPADARPGRQPGLRRPHLGAGRSGAAARGLRLPAAVAACADAVHGRGVRRVDAVPLLLRFRPRAGGRRVRRPPRRVRWLRGLQGRSCARQHP